jgi:hypothetical protein
MTNEEEQKPNSSSSDSLLSNLAVSKQYDWLEIKFLFGFALGAIIYILLAKTIVSQTAFGCYQTGFARSIIEVTLFPAGILFEMFNFPRRILDEIFKYILASLPYGVLGGLVSSGLWKPALYLLIFVSIYICLSLLVWSIFSGQMCA